MATVRTKITDTVYVEISTATDALVQNTSARRAKIVFNASLPDPDHAHFHVLHPNKIIQKTSSLPTGNIYAIMSDPSSTGFMSVS